MGLQVCAGAALKCTFGAAPGTLVVLPLKGVFTGTPAANVMDHKPMANVMPFGMCKSMGNPMVAAATAAAQGSLTPMPCIPATAAPWMPGKPAVLLGGAPALDSNSRLMCNWGGVISITAPGQATVSEP